MKNVIAYSLWGDKPMYWVGAQKNIELSKKLFPGWISRFYIDKNSDKSLIDSIKGDNVEVVLVDPNSINNTTNWQPNSFQGMFWRFWAAEDPDIDVFLSRDCDSRLSEREKLAIDEWLSSDKLFHIMRDHPFHTTPILGGMWGARSGIMRKFGLSNMIQTWCKLKQNYTFGVDQDFLTKAIYPNIHKMSLEHSEFGIKFSGDIKRFPSKRINYEFVGDVFDENDVRHPDYWKIIQKYEP